MASANGFGYKGSGDRLEVFLRDGRVEIDNHLCENSIRGIALGRRNWLFVGSPKAGPPSAAMISLIETCRRLGINVRQFLLAVLPKTATWPNRRVAELTPLGWKRARAAQAVATTGARTDAS